MLVIVESPYAPGTAFNVRYARFCLLDCLRRGEAPFASHLLYTQCLQDAKPAERKLGISAGLAWACRADLTVIYYDLGVSQGMAEGIKHARACKRPEDWRSLPGYAGFRNDPIHSATMSWHLPLPPGVK